MKLINQLVMQYKSKRFLIWCKRFFNLTKLIIVRFIINPFIYYIDSNIKISFIILEPLVKVIICCSPIEVFGWFGVPLYFGFHFGLLLYLEEQKGSFGINTFSKLILLITILIFFAIILYYIENSFFVINQFTTLFTASHVYFNYIKRMDFGLT